MHKNLLTLFVLLAPLAIFTQDNCQYDTEGNCIAKGKTKVITHKTSYGGKYTSVVRVGHWELFSEDGIKKAEG